MPVFTIETPGGKRLKIEAPDEGTAMRGAQEWHSQQGAAEQPAAPQQPQQPQQPDQPWYSKLGHAADDMARLFANGATFGYVDKVAGYMGGEGKDAERAKSAAAADRAGLAGTVADLAGSFATTGGLAKAGVTSAALVPKGMAGASGLAARTGAMAADGAALGALGATGHDTDVGTGAMIGAAAGGLGNVAGEALSAGASKLAGAFNKKPILPNADEIRAAKDAAYKAADDAGVVYTPDAIARIKQQAQAALAEKAYLPKNQPKIAAVLEALDSAGQSNVTMKGLDAIRKAASGAYDPTNKTSNSMISDIIRSVDDVVASPGKNEVLMGDAAAGAKALQEARALHAQSSKMETVETALTKAERQAASTGSGGNVDNATRQKFRAILDNPAKARGFSADEKDAMEQIIRGTGAQNFARLVGKLSPSGNGLMAALGVGATAVNPMMAAAPAVGMVAKKVADRATPNNVDALVDIIRAGGKKSDAVASPNAVQRLAESKKDALIRALMAGGLTVGSRATAQ